MPAAHRPPMGLEDRREARTDDQMDDRMDDRTETADAAPPADCSTESTRAAGGERKRSDRRAERGGDATGSSFRVPFAVSCATLAAYRLPVRQVERRGARMEVAGADGPPAE